MSKTPPLIDQGQRDLAVQTFDRDVLVSASAGTGKTSVLTERVVHALTEGKMDIMRILVLTFTEAAAEEMRNRITQSLRKASDRSGYALLGRQWLCMDAAPISTIHAFCKRTLDTYFFQTGLGPQCRILDEDQKDMLLTEALDKVLEDMWSDPQQASGLRILFNRRPIHSGRGGFFGYLKDVVTFLEGVPSPQAWLAQARQNLRCGYDASFQQELRSYWLAQHLAEIVTCMELSCRLDDAWCEGQYLTDFIQEQIQPYLDQWQQTLEQGRREDCIQAIRSFTWPPLPRRHLPYDTCTRGRVRQFYDRAKAAFVTLQSSVLFERQYDEQLHTYKEQQGMTLLELVARLRDTYAALKRQRQSLDYADLEHKLLDLFAAYPMVSEECRHQYDLIFLDEYQDINAVQKAILDTIRKPNRFFAVGDIKQSIYGFRQARPEIFLQALHHASDKTGNDRSLRVDLRTNFRCRREIINFTNMVFTRLMQPELGGLMYNQRAALLPGRLHEQNQDGCDEIPVELVLLAESPDEEQEGPDQHKDDLIGITARQRQAAWIAQHIQHMVQGGPEDVPLRIYDKTKNIYRQVHYHDIVILMRSVAGKAQSYVEMLRLAGVPVSSQSSTGYFENSEVLDILSLLKILDNPQQDIALAAVLRSALFSITDENMARIRLFAQEQGVAGPFFSCLTHYAQAGPDKTLRGQLQDVLQALKTWRTQEISLADLIWQIYRFTGYLSFVTGLPNGAQRRANLLKLHDRAIQFERGSHSQDAVSLDRFVLYIETLLEQRRDWSPAEPESDCTDTVRIMSIHRSKGLEFPVVFLADLERPFNLDTGKGPCLMHDTFGLGITVVDPEYKTMIKGPLHELIAHEHKMRDLAEELRILYVAVTRARDCLVLCASVNLEKAREIVTQAAVFDESPLPRPLILQSGSFLHWLLTALSDQRSLQQALDIRGRQANHDHPVFKVNVSSLQELHEISRGILDQQHTILQYRHDMALRKPAKNQITDSMLRALHWQYPFATATQLSAKQSVSELSHRDDEYVSFPVHHLAWSLRSHVPFLEDNDSCFSPNAREIGSALHLVMETLTLQQKPSHTSVSTSAQKLVTKGRIREMVLGHINQQSIVSFFSEDIGKHCFAKDAQVFREWPFTMRIPAPECNENEDDIPEFIIVQGIVDMIILAATGTYIVDFKSDHVQPSDILSHAVLYQQQLDLYEQAVQTILKPSIPTSKWIYFLRVGRSVQLT